MGPWLVKIDSREELDTWLGERPPVAYRPLLMVIRGDGPLIRELLPNALDAAKLQEERIVLWVRERELAEDAAVAGLFGEDDEVVAVVLGEDRRVVGRVYRNHMDVDDAAFAFAAATV